MNNAFDYIIDAGGITTGQKYRYEEVVSYILINILSV
jgi:hypothetical protein